MPATTIHRRAVRAIGVAAFALIATACPVDPPVTPPTGPSGPTAATVTAITPGGTGFSSRPISGDGRYVGYGRYNPDTFGTNALLWDRTSGASTTLAEPAGTGRAIPPVVSTDGSTVYTSSGEAPVDGPDAILRHDTASGITDRFDVPAEAPFSGKQVTGVASSADGSAAAVEVGSGNAFSQSDVAVWTEGGGFEVITDHSAIEAGDVVGYHLPGSALSENGRFVAVVTMFVDGTAPSRHSRLDVYDRTDDSWQTAWTGATTSDPSLYFENVTVLSTLDDGSVIFDVSTTGASNQFVQSQGVRRFDAGTATLSQVVAGDTAARGWSASPDGRYIGYTGSDVTGSPSSSSFGTPHLLDRQTGTILPAGSRPVTFPVGIGSAAADVLLFSFDPALNPTPAAGNSLFLWHRP